MALREADKKNIVLSLLIINQSVINTKIFGFGMKVHSRLIIHRGKRAIKEGFLKVIAHDLNFEE